MPQSCPYEHSEKYVEEERFELFFRDVLLLVEPVHEYRAEQEADNPAGGIPPEGDESEVSDDGIRVPKDER